MADPRALRGLLGDEQRAGRPERVRAFEADPLLFWRLRPGLDRIIWASTLVSTNAQGYRYPRDVGPKPAGGLRVICLGDSVTFGYQIPLVTRSRPGDYDREARAWPAALEERLQARHPGRPVEAIPLAVPGYTSHQGRAWLERDLARLEPDAVVVAFGWNDTDLRPTSDRDSMPGGWHHRLSRRVVLSSQLLIRAATWMRPQDGGRASAGARLVPRVPREDFVENHLAMARLAKRRGVPLLAVLPIYRDAVGAPATAERMAGHRRALGSALEQAGVAHLAVPELTEAAYPANEELFLEAVHPSAAGHALLAAAVERALAAAEMLPPRVRESGSRSALDPPGRRARPRSS